MRSIAVIVPQMRILQSARLQMGAEADEIPCRQSAQCSAGTGTGSPVAGMPLAASLPAAVRCVIASSFRYECDDCYQKDRSC